MSAVTATLYQVIGLELHARCKISFPSTEDERIRHYIRVARDDDEGLSMWTSTHLHDPLPDVILHTRHNGLEIEAQCDSVWVTMREWAKSSSEVQPVRLPTSKPYEHILRSLGPEEHFHIGDKKYTLHVDQAPPVQDIQVMSSRPGTNDADTPAIHGQESHLQPDNHLSTPDPDPGTAVLETPAAKRHQDPIGHPTSLTTCDDEIISPENQDQAVAANEVNSNDIDASNIIDLESKPGIVETGIDLHPNDDASTQTTESSDHELPNADVPFKDPATPEITSVGQRSPKKRRASPIVEGTDLDGAIPLATKSSGQTSARSSLEAPPPTKRQRRVSFAAEEESQDSVRSTIHVELPSIGDPTETAKRSPISPVHDVKQSEQSSTLSTPRNQKKSSKSPSSSHSTKQGQDSSQQKVTRILFASSSSLGESTAYKKFFRQHNIQQVKKVNDCDVLCTGKGELKRTSKLLLATLMGKEVVTDQWLMQSAEKDQPLDTAKFVPENKKRKQEWGTSLSDAIQRGREGLKPFEGWTINFTPSAKKELGSSWSELKEICLVAGAAVQAMIPRKSPDETDPTIVIAASNETDQATLDERGWTVFTKDIITFSALRGGIDADSEEFVVPAKKASGSAKKKGKKSRL
ncbi:MAG: hypothetical protein Q9169_004495 [Polycauliona sp. 2 TL-2023]